MTRVAKLGTAGLAQRLVPASKAFVAVARHRSLTWELAKRDVLGRYRGASLGLVWTLLGPIMMVAVYTIAFEGVLRAKWPTLGTGTSNFTLIVFIGLIVHGLFAECMIRSPGLVVNNPNYVKRIIFPLEILPWPMILSGFFHFLVNAVVFMIFHVWLEGAVPWTIVLLPLVLLPMLVLLVGLGWLLASLGTYFRDINQITGPVATAMLFLSPAIIPMETLPESYRIFFRLNPLTPIIDQARNVALWGKLPDWHTLAVYLVFSLIFAFGSCFWFQSTRKGFADVL